MTRRRSLTPGAVVLTLAAVVAVAILSTRSSGSRVEVQPPARALELLTSLPVKGRAPMTDYDRSLFGSAWADVDHNGCDTRNDVLNRDLEARSWRPGTGDCVVVAGRLHDPYTGRTITFAKVQAAAVQIDHVVALADAWQKGAQGWAPEVRRQFANDPGNLLAVDGPANQQKGSGDAATWLPRAAYRCDYVARQVAVKAAYGLWATRAEHDVMTRILTSCPATTFVP